MFLYEYGHTVKRNFSETHYMKRKMYKKNKKRILTFYIVQDSVRSATLILPCLLLEISKNI